MNIPKKDKIYSFHNSSILIYIHKANILQDKAHIQICCTLSSKYNGAPYEFMSNYKIVLKNIQHWKEI